MLGESDLMALDEDLQDVPWGLMSGEQQQQRQILSPIAALSIDHTWTHPRPRHLACSHALLPPFLKSGLIKPCHSLAPPLALAQSRPT